MPFSVRRRWMDPSFHALNRSVQPPMCAPPMKICGIVTAPVRCANLSAAIACLILHRIQVNAAVLDSDAREHLAHGPAELAPLEREQDDGLVAHDLVHEAYRRRIELDGRGRRGGGCRCRGCR